MKFLRSVVRCWLYNHETNEETKELNMYNLNEIIVDYRRRWIQHLFGMNNTGIPI